jgi:PAS domain S-box-containing protein
MHYRSVSEVDDSAARLAAIVASSDDAIVSKDLDGTIRTWNAAAERLFGYTAQEAIGRHITILIPQDRWGEEEYVISQVREGRGVEHYETIRRRKDGSLIDISLTVSPLRDSQGRVIGASKIARDISLQKRLQRVADEANRAKDEFLAMLSHELRTPLNTIVGYIAMLQRGKLDADQASKAFGVMSRNAQMLTQLVSDLLDTSQIVTGQMRLRFEPCDLATIAQDALDGLRPATEAKQVALTSRMASPAPYLGDPNRLLQVFWNLLVNAVKFTPPHGRIDLSVMKTPHGWRITVTDTGSGIDASALPRVFERFWQHQDGDFRTGSQTGLGLGLALSRHLVELHGGTIAAASPGPGLGATFTIDLPSNPPSPSASVDR